MHHDSDDNSDSSKLPDSSSSEADVRVYFVSRGSGITVGTESISKDVDLCEYKLRYCLPPNLEFIAEWNEKSSKK